MGVIWFPLILFIIGATGSYYFWKLDYILRDQIVQAEQGKAQDEKIGQLFEGQKAMQGNQEEIRLQLNLIMQKLNEHVTYTEKKK